MQYFREKRIIASSLNKQMVRRELLKESLGEELRVLYVAMTRAKEKLILTGAVGKLDKRIPSLAGFLEEEGQVLPAGSTVKGQKLLGFCTAGPGQTHAHDRAVWRIRCAHAQGRRFL